MGKVKKKKKKVRLGKVQCLDQDSSKDRQYAEARERRMYKGVKQKMATGGARV